MSAALMAVMRAANTKLASNLESKLNKTREESNKQTAKWITYVLEAELNKISENLETKLASVSESPGNRFNSVSGSLNETLIQM